MGSQFDIRKPEYLESYDHFKDPASFKQITEVVGRYLKQKSLSSVRCLDSMAGTGLVGRRMKELFPEIKVVYQDGSKQMLSSNVYQDSDERVLSNAKALELGDKSFDIVFCRAGLNNVKKEDYPKILAEYLRVLNDHGIVILMDHFARTEGEKKIINQIETEVKKIEGINDETYVPTAQELRELIQRARGRVTNEKLSRARFSMKERFMSKGIQQPDLSVISEILKAQQAIEYEDTKEDIFITYPITTVTISK